MSAEGSGGFPFAMNSFRGKQVLALLRDGDFAHAGEEEAIERTLREVPKNPERAILDAGCGRGGTAAYMQRNRWGQVTGIDREPRSIAHARDTYPEVRQSTLPATGWEVRRAETITAHYERWYTNLVAKIGAKRAAIEDLVGLDGYTHVHRLYSGLLERCRDARLGGLIILADRASGERSAGATR